MPLSLEEIGEWVAVASETAQAADPIRLREAVQRLVDDDHWKVYVDPADRQKHEWEDFRSFCERGLGISVEGLVHLLKSYPALANRVKHLGDAPLPKQGEIGGGHTEGRVDNVKPARGGNDENYTRRRLRRDHPGLYEKVLNGDLSPNAAALKAGFRRPQATVFIDTPEAAIEGLLRRFTYPELEKALRAHA